MGHQIPQTNPIMLGEEHSTDIQKAAIDHGCRDCILRREGCVCDFGQGTLECENLSLVTNQVHHFG